ncbi:hypothetical protein GYA19_01165 [Candidatus Beckwithbacteria bacterium]|nr:hypothetical protein [Candidatus Beckwithbacteria bacterium]
MATILTGISLWFPMRFLDKFILDTTKTLDLIILTLVAGSCGFVVYLLFSKIFQIEELDQFLAIFKKFGSWKTILSQSEEVIPESGSSVASSPVED